MEDTIDDALSEEGSAQAEEKIYSQVMDELGLNFQNDLPEALSSEVPHANANKAPVATPAGAGGNSGDSGGGTGPDSTDKNNKPNNGGGGAPASGGAGGEPTMSELEARLNNLRR